MPYNSIFQKEWWLDAVAPSQWKVAAVFNGNDIIARLPYVVKKRFGMTVLSMPPLTQTLGPWISPSQAKYAKALGREKELMTDLISQLPKCDLFNQNFHYSISNWLPFYWDGFSQTTRYTYIIDDISDPERVWGDFLERARTDIKKAQRKTEVFEPDIEAFLDVNEKTFARQGMSLPYSRDLVRNLDRECATRSARKIFAAKDEDDRIHAAIYVVWDDKSAYYLMGGGDPDLRNSGATSLLMWEAIKFCSSVTCKFDFEGSMIEPIERFFRSFGARQVPYFNVTKSSDRFKFASSVKSVTRRILRRNK